MGEAGGVRSILPVGKMGGGGLSRNDGGSESSTSPPVEKELSSELLADTNVSASLSSRSRSQTTPSFLFWLGSSFLAVAPQESDLNTWGMRCLCFKGRVSNFITFLFIFFRGSSWFDDGMVERREPSSELSMAWTQAGDEKVCLQRDFCILSPPVSLSPSSSLSLFLRKSQQTMEGDARVRVREINKMNEDGQNTPDSIRSTLISYILVDYVSVWDYRNSARFDLRSDEEMVCGK